MTQREVWQAAMDRLLPPSAVATYARTWGLTEAEARRALVSADQQLVATWRDELHLCSCGKGGGLDQRHCTYLVSGEQHDRIAFEYYQQTRGDT